MRIENQYNYAIRVGDGFPLYGGEDGSGDGFGWYTHGNRGGGGGVTSMKGGRWYGDGTGLCGFNEGDGIGFGEHFEGFIFVNTDGEGMLIWSLIVCV